MIVVLMIAFFAVNAFAEEFYVISQKKHECVACTGTLSAGGRWCDNGNGTITDMTTCLVWLKYADWGGQKKWRNNATSGETQYDDAHTRAAFLANGETIYGSGETAVYLSDSSTKYEWRMPTRNELQGLVNGSESVRSSTMQLFEEVQAYWYWSSSTVDGNTASAQAISLSGGGVGTSGKTNTYWVWPVRRAK